MALPVVRVCDRDTEGVQVDVAVRGCVVEALQVKVGEPGGCSVALLDMDRLALALGLSVREAGDAVRVTDPQCEAVAEDVCEAVRVVVPDGDNVGLRDRGAVGEADGVRVQDWEEVGLRVEVTLPEAVAVGDGRQASVTLAVRAAVRVVDAVSVLEWETVGMCEWEADGVAALVPEAVAERDALRVGAVRVQVAVGRAVRETEGVGVGDAVRPLGLAVAEAEEGVREGADSDWGAEADNVPVRLKVRVGRAETVREAVRVPVGGAVRVAVAVPLGVGGRVAVAGADRETETVRRPDPEWEVVREREGAARAEAVRVRVAVALPRDAVRVGARVPEAEGVRVWDALGLRRT